MTKTPQDIIYDYCQGRLNPNPEYYEGRGNELHDLNSPILEMVYQGVKTEYGPLQAKAFVNRDKTLKDTNAKNFLLEFYRLEKKGWRYADPVLKVRVAPVKTGEGMHAPKAPAPPAVPVRRMTEVLNAFKRGASAVGHDKAITSDFLAAHKDEVETSLIGSSFGG